MEEAEKAYEEALAIRRRLTAATWIALPVSTPTCRKSHNAQQPGRAGPRAESDCGGAIGVRGRVGDLPQACRLPSGHLPAVFHRNTRFRDSQMHENGQATFQFRVTIFFHASCVGPRHGVSRSHSKNLRAADEKEISRRIDASTGCERSSVSECGLGFQEREQRQSGGPSATEFQRHWYGHDFELIIKMCHSRESLELVNWGCSSIKV
jgi:hypothetical protein